MSLKLEEKSKMGGLIIKPRKNSRVKMKHEVQHIITLSVANRNTLF